MDYIATGNVRAEKVADIVKGVADGCVLGQCALVGGETAEMPDFYADGEYDMAGFAVGIADKSNIIDGSRICEGDTIIGIPSSGIHSNGYSLVRKACFDKAGLTVDGYVDDLGETLGEALLRPTRIYTEVCKKVWKSADVKGMIHITGGGFYENIPRIIPEGLGVHIDKDSWDVLPVFDFLKNITGGSDEDMFATFNMGIGMMFVVDPDEKDAVISAAAKCGDMAFEIGSIIRGQGVEIC